MGFSCRPSGVAPVRISLTMSASDQRPSPVSGSGVRFGGMSQRPSAKRNARPPPPNKRSWS